MQQHVITCNVPKGKCFLKYLCILIVLLTIFVKNNFLRSASHSPSLVYTPGGGLPGSRLRPGGGGSGLPTPGSSYPTTPAHSRPASPLLHHRGVSPHHHHHLLGSVMRKRFLSSSPPPSSKNKKISVTFKLGLL